MMIYLKFKIRGLLKFCLKWTHLHDEAEALVQEALSIVEASDSDQKELDSQAFPPETLNHDSIAAAPRAGRMTTVSMNEGGENAAVLAEPRSGPEEISVAQQKLRRNEALVVRHWGRQTYEVFMYQRSGHTQLQTALKFKLTERAVRTHIARAMFVLINQRAGEHDDTTT